MRKLLSALLVALTLAGATACTKGSQWQAPGETADPPKVELTGPTDGATDVQTAAEIAFTVAGTRDVTVNLVDGAGTAVPGQMRADGSSWVPQTQLQYGTTYTATVTATKSDGSTGEGKSTFTTMAQPANLVDVHSFIGDDQTVGVAMPIIIDFGLLVPEERRPEIEKRLFVTSDPPQEGVWNWYSNEGTEKDILHYRPKEYWQSGTTVRVATGGLWWGIKDWYGRHDLSITFTVGQATIMDVDNATKTMTVTQDGQVVREIPVSLGKPSTPSSSGTMVVIDKNVDYTFDTRREIEDGYIVDVKYAMRLTWGGEFVHAAPWSVSAQGRRNVSHGCVNMSMENAEWLFNTVRVGDPITVKGTEVDLTWGNGWTDWDVSWDEYVEGSALPYQPPAASPTPAATPSGP
jgi:lipoprotein-anchoring transpeptidase ErfK/SrfK